MFGSTGSTYGGMKMRPAFAPCWWMSLLICSFASVDGSEMNATRKGLPNVVLPSVRPTRGGAANGHPFYSTVRI